MKTRTIVAIVLALSVLAPSAVAHHITVRDGSSERGPLDVKRVQQWGGAYAKWKINTHHKWTRKKILDQGFLTVYLDTFGSKRHDYYALVWADKDKLRGTLMRDPQQGSDYAVRSLVVKKLNAKTVRITVPLNKLRVGDNRATYNWYVQTLWSGNGCSQVCFDWAPNIGKNGGGIEEPLPLSV